MRRTWIIGILLGLPLLALGLWIANNTHWVDTKVPAIPKGEALTNPFYPAQRFADALGARTSWERVLVVPASDAVIVLGDWHWSLSAPRRTALERWVASGGRLVVDTSLIGNEEQFERWSGIVRGYPEDDEDAEEEDEADGEDLLLEREVTEAVGAACRSFEEEQDGVPVGEPATGRMVCAASEESFLTSDKQVAWALRDPSGIQAMRVAVGRGSVTVINAKPFMRRALFDGDHAWLFVAATQLRPGDEVHFLSEEKHASLLALTWRYGAPVVMLTLAGIALALWRGAVRFGPMAAPPTEARRSLAEQIRGTGQFALRHGDGDALHAASVRALDEAARRRVKDYANLPARERAEALERLTGFNGRSLASAIHHPDSRRQQELRRTIARLEAARRHILASAEKSPKRTQ